jgi:MscS family membrane protein
MKRIAAMLLLYLFVACSSARGKEAEHPLLPVDTSSPRATLYSFIDNCNQAYRLLSDEGRSSTNQEALSEGRRVVRRILRCMDLSQIAEFRRDNEAKEAALALKEVLDRIELPEEVHIPDREMMTKQDGELLDRWTIPYTEITFTLVEDGPLAGSYQFSHHTIENARDYYERVKHLPYKPGATVGFASMYLSSPGSRWLAAMVQRLPASLHVRRHGQALWQWIGLVIVLFSALMLMVSIYFLGRRVSRGGAEAGMPKYLLGLLFPVLAFFVPLKTLAIVTDQLVISGSTLFFIRFHLSLLAIFAGMVVIMGIGRRVGELIVSAPHIRSHSIDAQLIRVLCRVISLVAAMVLLLEGGKHLGIPLSSLLAGAGVVGMALALSAQDVLKNVFGSIMIIMDKPFVVGDRIKVKQYDGFVEEVGLRSTKIRLLDGHQAVIPNEDMARSDIENIGRRPFIRRVSEIPLPIHISAEKAARAVDIVKRILENHEGQQPSHPPRVWLNEFERDHLSLRFIYWYHPPDYWQYTEHVEKVNHAILKAFVNADIEMTVPAFVTRLDEKRSAAHSPPQDRS